MTRKLLGCLLLGFGISVLLLPVLQALLFFALGTFVLRGQFAWAEAAVAWVRQRAPLAVEAAESAEARAVGWSRAQAAKLRRLL